MYIFFFYIYIKVDVSNPYKMIILDRVKLRGWSLHLRII